MATLTKSFIVVLLCGATLELHAPGSEGRNELPDFSESARHPISTDNISAPVHPGRSDATCK